MEMGWRREIGTDGCGVKGHRRDDDEEDVLTSCNATCGWCTGGGMKIGFPGTEHVDVRGEGWSLKGFIGICGSGGGLKTLGDFRGEMNMVSVPPVEVSSSSAKVRQLLGRMNRSTHGVLNLHPQIPLLHHSA